MYKSIRDMMLFHTRQFTEPRMIIQQARAFLDFAAANAGKQTPYSLLLRGELERLKVQSDAYLYHDHLEHNNIPVYFHEFMHHAGEKGLRYLADAAFHTMTPSEFGPEVQQTLRNLSDKIVGMEQYMDFLRNRSFRSTLLCRREVQLTRKIDVSSIQKFQFASALQPNPEPDPSMQPGLHSFKHPSGSELRTGESLMVAVLEYFAENWPTWKPLDHVVKGVREKVLKSAAATKPEVSDTTVGSFVLQLFQQGLVELHVIPPAFTTKVSTRPTASALARTQIKERLELTNLRHERVVLPDVFRHIASQCDGTKDKAQLAVLVEAAVKEGTLTMREGKALPEPGPERTKYLQNIVESALKYLSRAALLSA
jgi:methyltransferase-like protein